MIQEWQVDHSCLAVCTGGDLQLISMEGHGVDSYLHLNRLGMVLRNPLTYSQTKHLISHLLTRLHV